MGLFRVYLTGSPQAIDVELPVSDLRALKLWLLSERFLEGRVRPEDGDGVCSGVLIPTARLQLILEL